MLIHVFYRLSLEIPNRVLPCLQLRGHLTIVSHLDLTKIFLYLLAGLIFRASDLVQRRQNPLIQPGPIHHPHIGHMS